VLGGFNKVRNTFFVSQLIIINIFSHLIQVTKNDQWSKVYIRMGLPDEASPKNNRLIENAYKK
jgi:hypothetical protein